jgi:hypothetical protein
MIEKNTRQENGKLHDVRDVADDANEDPAEVRYFEQIYVYNSFVCGNTT